MVRMKKFCARAVAHRDPGTVSAPRRGGPPRLQPETGRGNDPSKEEMS